jgi:hypothetical protein
MNKPLQLVLVVATLALTFANTAFAQNPRSGRDNFGYTWLRNDTTGGTPYNWVDIAATGTRATGLGDDNIIGPIPIGFNFTYYWNTYNQVYIGSNGYIMFGRGDNVASGTFGGRSGMPPFPFADTKNNYIGALLADLSFIRANGTPAPNAALYYETRGTQFIVTYNAVPFWNANTAGEISGSNTFQIILDAADSSFAVQYLACSGTPYSGYNGNRTSRGFEDINGANGSSFGVNISLATLNNKNYTVKYPRNSTFRVTDLSAEGVFNNENGAQFLVKGSSNNIVSAVVRNAGTTDITTPFNVTISVEDAVGNLIANAPVAVPSLSRGTSTTVSLPSLPSTAPAGNYLVQVGTSLAGDAVASNNNIAGELVIVDTTIVPNVFTYATGQYPAGASQNFAGNNFGVYYEFPFYPVVVTGAEFDMGWVSSATDYLDSSRYKISFRFPNASGAPGPVVDSMEINFDQQLDGDSIAQLILQGSVAGPIRRHKKLLNNTIVVYGGGIYIGVTRIGRDPRFFWNRVMADTIAPFSNRIFEIQGGTWGPDRNRAETDYALGVITQTSFTSTRSNLPRTFLKTYPNPASDFITLSDDAFNNVASIQVLDAQGRIVKSFGQSDIQNNSLTFNINALPRGAYLVKATTVTKTLTSRFVKN